MAVVVGLRRPEKTDQLMMNIPAFCRDDIFFGVNNVEVHLDKDERGRFLKVRPVPEVS